MIDRTTGAPSTSPQADSRSASAWQMILRAFSQYRGILVEGVLATLLINLLAVAASFYSMQVYDRVIPTQGMATLGMLTLGVGLSIGLELLLKLARSRLMEFAVIGLDTQMSRSIFQRLLGLRLDQLPPNVGSLAGQLRAYESIRALMTSSMVYLWVDLPFCLVFMALIAHLGGAVLLWVPVVFLVISSLLGWVLKGQIESHARQAAGSANGKTGLLVEAVEGAEVIKSAGAHSHLVARWMQLHDRSIRHEVAVRRWSELGGYAVVAMQQLAYVALVALGAWQVMEGRLSMGALVACTLLGGRALAPAGMLSGLLVQLAHAKAALQGLESVYALASDDTHHGQPLKPDTLQGGFRLQGVHFGYNVSHGLMAAVRGLTLNIPQGQKLGVLGPVGCGKSTLLRLMAGLYTPHEGRVFLDQMDLTLVARSVLSEQMGYLPQDVRLLQGTVRDNLLLGLPSLSDSMVLEACRKTGLIHALMAHPMGLDLPIAEGGKGMSGGQRQLVALTRLLLRQPRIWLLDEPTAHMDDELERRCTLALAEWMQPGQTAVIVTHKPAVLALTDHLLVMGPQGVLLHGPRDEVLRQLQATVMEHPPGAGARGVVVGAQGAAP